MKRCFAFDNSKECKLLLAFLQKVITTPIHVQLGNAIIVADGAYPKAILEGKKYAIENNISCNWVDVNDNVLPLEFVPLVTISLKEGYITSPYCLNATCLPSITHFADFCESFLKRKIFVQIRKNGTIAFLVEQSLSVTEHLEESKSLQEHKYYLHDNIYAAINYTDYFGNSISIY